MSITKLLAGTSTTAGVSRRQLDRLFHRVYVYMSGDNLLKEGDA